METLKPGKQGIDGSSGGNIDLDASGAPVRVFQFDYSNASREGEANDRKSKKPGLTAYITAEGMWQAEELCQRLGSPIPASQIRPITPDISVIDLPQGVYGVTRSKIQFFQEVKGGPDFVGEFNGLRRGFYLNKAEVVRIEGAANTLWQNPQYTWDGTPKPQ